ncbi:MAG TPA: MFS transporter [Candidatus Baltobacteraceae bacterium]|jgi:MFS family permease|nr:MFS transporter [Candidatus Baltobacteraceae bacterium]
MSNAVPRPRIPRNVLILSLVALASGFGQDLITPVLPAYLALIGVSHAGIGLIDGALQGATQVFRFVSGVLSDRFAARKRFVFLGYALSSVSRPLLALSGGFASALGLRLVDGVGKGVKDAPRDALVADSSAAETRGRAFGFHRLVDTAGSVFGPLTAGAILLALTPSLASYRAIFLLSAVPGAVALALILFGIRDPEKPRARSRGVARKLPAKFWIFTVAMAVAMLTKMNDSLFLTRTQEAGVPAAWIPVLFAGFTLVYALLSYPLGVWSDRVGRLPLLAAGWLLLAAVELGFGLLRNIPSALVLLAGYGVFYALTEGSGRAMVADLAPPEARGTAYAVFYVSIGLAVIVGGFGLGRLWDSVSPAAAFMVSAAGSALGGVLFLAMMRYTRKEDS